MRTEVLNYPADGLAMQGWLAYDETLAGPRPGVLVFSAMPGLGVQAKTSAERLGSVGYVALAADLYGGGHFYDDIEEAMPPFKALIDSPTAIVDRSRGALDALAGLPQVDASRIAAMGYCLGGKMSLDFARSGAPLRAVIGFHTQLKVQRPPSRINPNTKVLVCTGSMDPEAPAADRAAFEQEMTAAGVDWRLHLYGGVYHSFTNPDADSYNKPEYARYNRRAAERSWREMLDVLEEAFAAD